MARTLSATCSPPNTVRPLDHVRGIDTLHASPSWRRDSSTSPKFAIARAADPLPSWNDTAPKQAITAFVEKVTKQGSADFVPVAESFLATLGIGRSDLRRLQDFTPDQLREAYGTALAAHGMLAPAEAEELAEAYRTYRQRMHHLNLAGAPGLVPRAEAAALVATVVRHWRAVFYTDIPQPAE